MAFYQSFQFIYTVILLFILTRCSDSTKRACEYPSACGLGRFEEALPQGLLEARLKVKVLLAPANRDQQLHNSSLDMDSRKNNKKNLFKQIIAFKQIKSKLIEYINKMIDDKFLKINQF